MAGNIVSMETDCHVKSNQILAFFDGRALSRGGKGGTGFCRAMSFRTTCC